MIIVSNWCQLLLSVTQACLGALPWITGVCKYNKVKIRINLVMQYFCNIHPCMCQQIKRCVTVSQFIRSQWLKSASWHSMPEALDLTLG